MKLNFFCVLCCFAFLAGIAAPHFVSRRSFDFLEGDYRILTVNADASDSDVLRELEKQNVDGVVAWSRQYYPYPTLGGEIGKHASEIDHPYMSAVKKWFFAADSLDRFYYIPDGPDLDKKVNAALSFARGSYRFEDSLDFGFLADFMLVVFLLVSAFFSRKKAFLLCASAPFISYAFARRNPSAFFAAAFAIAAVYRIASLLRNGGFKRRERAVVKLFADDAVLLSLCVSSLTAAVTGGAANELLCVCAWISAAAAVCLNEVFALYRARASAHKTFEALCINRVNGNGSIIDFVKKNFAVCFAVCAAASAVFVFAGASSRAAVRIAPERASARASLVYPFSASGYKDFIAARSEDRLSDLGDYALYVWEREAAPFARVDSDLSPPDDKIPSPVYLNRYRLNGDGSISPYTQRMLAFDDDFIEKTLNASLPPLESMLRSCKSFVDFSPDKSGSGLINYEFFLRAALIALICFTFTAFVCFLRFCDEKGRQEFFFEIK